MARSFAAGENYIYGGDGLRDEKSSGTRYSPPSGPAGKRVYTCQAIETTDTSGRMQRDYVFFFDGRRSGSDNPDRFLSPDPLGGNVGNPQSLNRYSYVGNNPENFVDPLGLTLCPPMYEVAQEAALLGTLVECGGGGGGGESCAPVLTGAAEGGETNMGMNCEGNPGQEMRGLRLPPPTNLPLGKLPSADLTPAPTPQTPAPKQPLLVCAAETANKYSLAQLAGTNGKSGFFNSLANGVLGNTFSTVTEFAYGGSSTEFGTTAYDFGTKATESSINAVTGAAPITDLGLGAESAGQIAEGVATEGLGGIVTAGKIIYDAATFGYGVAHCW